MIGLSGFHGLGSSLLGPGHGLLRLRRGKWGGQVGGHGYLVADLDAGKLGL